MTLRSSDRRTLLLAIGVLFVMTMALAAGTGLFAWRHALAPTVVVIADVPFDERMIDRTAGDIKLVGDIDGDALPDLIVGGMPDEPLTWYRYPDWTRTIIAVAATQFTTDGSLGDVDGDGDLDIVVPDGNSDDNLIWFENPRSGRDPANGSLWRRHVIGSIGSWGKDVELADFDSDGRLDVATRSPKRAMIFFQSSPTSWQRTEFGKLNLGSEGMTGGDIDGDGQTDLVLRGVWLRNPGAASARSISNWIQYAIGDAPAEFKALITDLNGDGIADVLYSSSEGTADIVWWTSADGDPTGAWKSHTILADMEKVHTLEAADMDLDGDIDVVLGQMHTSAKGEIMILHNVGGDGARWTKQVVGRGGLHNGVVADIGNDGDYDIYGANWTGNPPLRIWENHLETKGPLERWTYRQITNRHTRTFGLDFGDMDSDGRADIVSGEFWYRNPGGDLLGEWAQAAFPTGMHVFLVTDSDDDGRADAIAQKDDGEIGIYWVKHQSGDTGWDTVRIGGVPRASHALGAQGYARVSMLDGKGSAILISSGDGIYTFRVPPNPQGGNWPRTRISPRPSDEGLAVGDIDGDGLPDVAATTGNAKGVEWYQNPGDGSADWPAYTIGSFADAVFPDRVGLGDLNGDGRLDIVATEENGGENDAETYWWEQPPDTYSVPWQARRITSWATTNSLDVADMDGDGVLDVVLAEHRGQMRLSVWRNDGRGQFTESRIGAGMESHLGGRAVDLSGDGDLDIVSIAWDDFAKVHLWRNDAARAGRSTGFQ